MDRVDHGLAVTDEIIGRDAELARVHAFLDRPADGLRALVLEGDAGIGKSTVWKAGVMAARERAFHVLVSRPAETEQTLPNLVLGDLLGDVAPRVLSALPEPRRRALEAALLLGDEPGLPVDSRALGVAVATLLPTLGAGQLVLAIDDDLWMDSSSAATLEFALRRSATRPVLLLLSRRLGGGRATGLEAIADPDRIERLRVGPLSVGAIQLLLRQRLGISFPRPTLIRLHEASGGNPFYSLELARAQSMDPTRDPTLPATVPASLDGLVDARLETQASGARHALLLIAAHGRLPVALLGALDVTLEAFDSPIKAGLIERTDEVISFTHPLLASAVYRAATGEERRATHRLLAAALDDPVLRGRQLALGADGEEPELAAELEGASRTAHDRGIPIAAAELAEQALRLTPTTAVEDRHRRAIATARANFEAGDGMRALGIAADLRTTASPGRRRAEALVVSADVGQPDEALAFLSQALVEASGVPALRATIHAGLAGVGRGTKELAWAEQHAEASLRLAERLDDDALRARALAVLAPIRYDRGDPLAFGLAERAYVLAAQLGDEREMKWAGWSVGHMLTWSGLTDRAREWLERQLALWGDRDEEARWTGLKYLALVELWAGRWSLASQYAEEARQVSVQYGPEEHFALTFVTLYRGELAAARSHAHDGLRQLRSELIPAFPAALGICELWSDRPAAALPYFAEAERMSDARGLDEPNNRWWRSEHVEALLKAGRVDEAERLLDRWDAVPASLSRDRVAAQSTRCRGLLAAARGELSLAGELLELAVQRLEAAGDQFGQARALLSLGLVRRRELQKRAARAALDAALAGFEVLGAGSWAAATRAELGRIGGRQRIEGLSPSELSVATLVAEGRTNREIAATLFVGERTVASHLTHIYSKLGLRSRTELARHLPSRAEPLPGDATKVPTS